MRHECKLSFSSFLPHTPGRACLQASRSRYSSIVFCIECKGRCVYFGGRFKIINSPHRRSVRGFVIYHSSALHNSFIDLAACSARDLLLHVVSPALQAYCILISNYHLASFCLNVFFDPFVHFLYSSLPPRWWAESFISSGCFIGFSFYLK